MVLQSTSGNGSDRLEVCGSVCLGAQVQLAPYQHDFDLVSVVALIEAGHGSGESWRDLLAALVQAIQDREGLQATRLEQPLGVQAVDLLTLARSDVESQAVHFRLEARQCLLDLMETTYQLREALIHFAESHGQTLILAPSAAPQGELTTLGHWALMIDSALTRDSERMVALYNRMNRSPAGAVSTSGSDLAFNRLRMAELLGFDGLVENTYDALQNQDLALEFGAVLMILSQSLARLCNDLIEWSTQSDPVLQLPERFCLIDPHAPHQRVPVYLQQMRGLAVQALTGLSNTAFTEGGTTGSPLAARAAHYYRQRALSTDIVQGLQHLAALLDGLVVYEARGLDRAKRSWDVITDLARLFTRDYGLAWRHAATLAGDVARYGLERGLRPDAITAADVAQLAQEAGETDIGPDLVQIRTALDPQGYISRRKTQGGPADEAMAAGLASAQARIRLGRSRLADRLRAISHAQGRRVQAAEALLARAAGTDSLTAGLLLD